MLRVAGPGRLQPVVGRLMMQARERAGGRMLPGATPVQPDRNPDERTTITTVRLLETVETVLVMARPHRSSAVAPGAFALNEPPPVVTMDAAT
jgi:hypothetical protein